MEKDRVFTSDLLLMAKLVTPKNCKLVVLCEEQSIVYDLPLYGMELITKWQPGQTVYRDADKPFLLAIDFTLLPVKLNGFDGIINFFDKRAIGELEQYDYQYRMSPKGNISDLRPALFNKGEWEDKSYKYDMHIFLKSGQPYVESLLKSKDFTVSHIEKNTINYLLIVEKYSEERNCIKIPLSETTKRGLLKELSVMEAFQPIVGNSIRVANGRLLDRENGVTELELDNRRKNGRFEIGHFAKLGELYFHKDYFKKTKLIQSQYIKSIKKRMLRNEGRHKENNTYTSLMAETNFLLNYATSEDVQILTTFSHGLVPYEGMFVSDELIDFGVLYINDWDRFNENFPLYYDFFNMLFQECASKPNSTHNEVIMAIADFFTEREIESLIRKNPVSLKKYFIYYLLDISSNYLERFGKDKDSVHILDFLLHVLSTENKNLERR